MCVLLNKAMRGVRDAAMNWEAEYTEMLVENGFGQGRSNPCVFFHPEREVRVVVRGDDFTVMGKEAELDGFRKVISDRMTVKFRARLRCGEEGSVRILNRIVTVASDGLEYEADQRHAELVVREAGVNLSSK